MSERIVHAKELLKSNQISGVLGWKKGDFSYNPEPALFKTETELDDFTYDSFCGANLSKYLRETKKAMGKILVFLKPCDTYSYNQLLKEHQINREDSYIIGVACNGKLDIEKIRIAAPKGILNIAEDKEQLTVEAIGGNCQINRDEVLLEKCRACKGRADLVCDELEAGDGGRSDKVDINQRFLGVTEVESLNPAERFTFWQQELSKCIRCNACRNVCPVCTCKTCVFDGDAFDISAKVSADPFEDKLFHLVRAYHVAGRCSDCGECSRVCPQNIPLHLLNRKMIKDINAFYGEYQAGMDTETFNPLQEFTIEDMEPLAALKMNSERG